MKNISQRLAALEALEGALRPVLPAYVCVHPRDAAALADPATPSNLRAQIAAAYGIGGEQKCYVGTCLCWEPGESCRVCSDRPVVQEL